MPAAMLRFHDDARERMLRGVDLLADAVRVTLGPRGRTVILEREDGVPQIVNSGVVVARAIVLDDPFENIGAQLLREVAALAREARPCHGAQAIAQVAAISANNDRAIGELLAAAIERVGREGAILIEEGSGLASELQVVDGLRFDRGFLSPYFVNTPERQRVVLEDAAIMLVDGRVGAIAELLPVLEAVVKDARGLLVVADEIEGDALATLVLNTMRGTLRTCAVRAPDFGDRRRALLEDIAVLTGATLLGQAPGRPLDKAAVADLGRCRRIEVTRMPCTPHGPRSPRASCPAVAPRCCGLVPHCTRSAVSISTRTAACASSSGRSRSRCGASR